MKFEDYQLKFGDLMADHGRSLGPEGPLTLAHLAKLRSLLAYATQSNPLPWYWNQVKSFGARVFLWPNKKQPYTPIAELSGLGFVGDNFLCHAINRLSELIDLAEEALKKREESE